jgi:putative transposase
MSSTFTNLLYHIVYSTRYRRQLVASDWQRDLYSYIGGIINERDGIPLEIGGMPDHIHILAKLSPRLAIMGVLRDIKAVSSKWINERQLLPARFEWQTGYGAFSVSQSQVEVVPGYIRNQEQHHRHTPFQVEFITLLKRHAIEFDPRYVFEEEHIA